MTTSSPPSLETPSNSSVSIPQCLSHSYTKVATCVLILLFAAGALASHYGGLGIPGIVAFSIASVVSLTLFVIGLICEVIYRLQISSICAALLGPSAANELAEVRNDPKLFLLKIPTFFRIGHPLLSVAKILEWLPWPSEALKKEKLPALLAEEIGTRYISIETADHQSFSLFITTRKLFGLEDFASSPQKLPNCLGTALGTAIQDTAKTLMNQRGITLNPTAEIKIHLIFNQSDECRFKGSMIEDVLPYLAPIPGLVALELNNAGFEDRHADALYKIFETNSSLNYFVFNCDLMTETAFENFEDRCIILFKSRGQESPVKQKGVRQLLSPTKHRKS